jgi:hypothetical protein
MERLTASGRNLVFTPWSGAVNRGSNNKRLREIILTTTGKGNKHTSNTNDLL